jgi:hypothetical protein
MRSAARALRGREAGPAALAPAPAAARTARPGPEMADHNGTRRQPMKYQSMEQIAANAKILGPPALSRQARLERWAQLLERQPELLRAIPDVELGPGPERDARHADGSPLAVAFADPVLRVGGLQGDRIGDAAEFFGLSHRQLHRLVCSCHHGATLAPFAMTGGASQGGVDDRPCRRRGACGRRRARRAPLTAGAGTHRRRGRFPLTCCDRPRGRRGAAPDIGDASPRRSGEQASAPGVVPHGEIAPRRSHRDQAHRARPAGQAAPARDHAV